MKSEKTVRQAAILSAMMGATLLFSGCVIDKSNVKHTTLSARTGTVADVHGNVDVSTRPASCLAGAPPFPNAPDAWWLGLSPSVRDIAPVTGYRVWANPTPPTGCPRDFQTVVYRGFYEVDITPFVGKSGGILKAVLKVNERGNSVTPQTVSTTAVTASLCDSQLAGAFQVRRVPPSTAFNNGFTRNNINPGQFDPNLPPIPNAFPAGTNVFNFPTKTPDRPADGQRPRQFDIDITRDVVATLQAFEASAPPAPIPARYARMVFMMTGTNEPPALKNGPLPFSDCRGAYSIELDVQQP